MSAKKYTYKPKNRDNDDSNSLSSPCFEISPDVELKDVPTTGEEYLLKVMKERENYSAITKCNRDYSRFAENQSCFVVELPHAKAPENLKPTIEWQNIQVAEFSDVRMYISRMLVKKSLWPKDMKENKIDPNNTAAWKNFFEKQQPTLCSLLSIPITLMDTSLEVLVELLDNIKPGSTIDYKTGKWIYSVLACIRQPLLSETTGILRDLARKCADIRSHLNPEDEQSKLSVMPLNIFICLVSRYFRQYDLAD